MGIISDIKQEIESLKHDTFGLVVTSAGLLIILVVFSMWLDQIRIEGIHQEKVEQQMP